MKISASTTIVSLKGQVYKDIVDECFEDGQLFEDDVFPAHRVSITVCI